MISYRQPFQGIRMVEDLAPVRPVRTFGSALIVDDHPLFCDALTMTLTGPVGINHVESTGTMEKALARLSAAPLPDVILLDLSLPDVNGLEGVLRLRQAVPDTPIIVVSSLDELRVVRAALRAGVNGFVPKHAEREEFAEAFAAIARGEVYATRMALDTSAPSLTEEAVSRLALLTKQQARILQLVSAGLMNKQIAYELSIAETTVKAHLTAIMRKLGVQTRMQAVLFAQEASFAAMTPDA